MSFQKCGMPQSVFVEVKLSCKGVGWASVEAGVDFC